MTAVVDADTVNGTITSTMVTVASKVTRASGVTRATTRMTKQPEATAAVSSKSAPHVPVQKIPSPRIVFRVDASMQIGTGHVMRCLTLARTLADHGAVCEFICRGHSGNLVAHVRDQGFVVHELPGVTQLQAMHGTEAPKPTGRPLAHSSWLGTTQPDDGLACLPILCTGPVDWLIVDHYSLDAEWQNALQPYYQRLMVIDDLADRQHVCDLLLDQTYGRDAADYQSLVPAHCELLCGSQFALLRPEFAALRGKSLQRRHGAPLRQLLISLGGVDQNNVTLHVLKALCGSNLPANCQLVVIMGANAPWRDAVQTYAAAMPWPTRVLVNVSNMAELMATSDLAIGAAGATSWERCCLGLPTLILTLAANQQPTAEALQQVGAAQRVDDALSSSITELIDALVRNPQQLADMAKAASEIVDGQGSARVARRLLKGDSV